MSRCLYPKQLRLSRPAEFDRVFQRRCSTADGLVIIYAAPNHRDHPRLGLVVSRKVGRAVLRNRWKRMLREAFRLTQDELPALDLVCLPRRHSEPDMWQLTESLPELARRLERKLAFQPRKR